MIPLDSCCLAVLHAQGHAVFSRLECPSSLSNMYVAKHAAGHSYAWSALHGVVTVWLATHVCVQQPAW